MTQVLLTGAAGFAGSHIAEEIINYTNWNVIALDCLTYAGRLDRLAHLPKNRIISIHHDFSKPFTDELLQQFGDVKYIIHNGAETHVKRSFENPVPFIQSNVVGTFNVLEAAVKLKPEKVIYTSTDEVFGTALDGQSFKETDALNPSNPYSATKAAGEMLVSSYRKSFHLPVIITRTMNMFGERQHPEKFLPMTVKKLLDGEVVTIHTDAHGGIGSRQWLHAGMQASAILYLLRNSPAGEVFHISGVEKNNLQIASMIADILEMGLHVQWENAFEKYPAHDLRYALDGSKIKRFGWVPMATFEHSFQETVRWYAANRNWLRE